MLEIWAELTNRLEDNDIAYCQWNHTASLSESLDGEGDLDVLVDPHEEENASNLLRELDFERLRTAPHSTAPSLGEYIGYDATTGRIVRLRLHHRLVLGRPFLNEFRLPWETALLEHRINDDDTGVDVVHPRHELLVLIVRTALKLRWRNYLFESLGAPLVSGSVRDAFEDLRRTVTQSELEQASRELNGSDGLDELVAIYEKGPSVWRLRRFRASLPMAFDQHRRYGRVGGEIVAKARELQSVAVEGIKNTVGKSVPSQTSIQTGGLSVAFIGADGSGKSTVSTEVCDELRRVTDAEQIYFGHGESGESLLQAPKRFERWVGRLLLSTDGSESELDYRDTPNAHRIKSSLPYQWWNTAAMLLVSLDKLLKVRRMNRARHNGGVVITDRYPNLDPDLPNGPSLDHWRNASNGLKRTLAEIERRPYELAHQHPPDVVIRLMIPVETAMDRKSENTLERAKSRIAQVRGMEIGDVDIVDVDATQELDDVVSESLSVIWRAL